MKIVVLDDSEDITYLLEVLLQRHGHWVSSWVSPIAAMDEENGGASAWDEADLAIVDYDLGYGITGVDVLRWAKDRGFAGKSLIITGSPGAWANRDEVFVDAEVDAVLGKVFDIDDLLTTIERLAEA